jgi:hypothetical protein
MEVSCQLQALAASLPDKICAYPLNRNLVGPIAVLDVTENKEISSQCLLTPLLATRETKSPLINLKKMNVKPEVIKTERSLKDLGIDTWY